MHAITVRLKRHYLPLLAISLLSAIIFYLAWNKVDTLTFTADATGYISLILLAATLLMGPVNLYLGKINPVSTYLRRDLGIYAGLLALIHSGTGLFVHLRGNMWQYFFQKTNQGFTVRMDDFGWANYTGLIAAILIILLLITSNDYSIGKLNPFNWKNLQRLAYLMFALVLLHSIYYRIVANSLDRVYFLYLPVLGIILVFQMVGIVLKRRHRQAAPSNSPS